MNAYPVGKAVIDLVKAKLADVPDGFNATYNALKSQYAVADAIAIDFDPVSRVSKNFVMANVTPEDWTATGNPVSPFMTLYVDNSRNQNLQKFHQFSGEVVVGLNVFLSWSNPKLFIDVFEAQAGLVEESVYTIFNRARGNVMSDQEWSDEVTYNGDIECRRSRLERGEKFWVQALAFRATFEVDQRGDV